MIRDLKASLAREVLGCQLCVDLLPNAPRPIVQLGFNAPILIAGQAPGRVAHTKGLAFDDASGDRLRAWLGVTREQFYNPQLFSILPMGFCFPGAAVSGDLPPRPECAARWRRELLAQHSNLALQIIIGQHAQKWHLSAPGNLTATVKNWRQYWPTAVPLAHPSPRNNRWLKANSWFLQTLVPVLQAKVKRLVTDHGKA